MYAIERGGKNFMPLNRCQRKTEEDVWTQREWSIFIPYHKNNRILYKTIVMQILAITKRAESA